MNVGDKAPELLGVNEKAKKSVSATIKARRLYSTSTLKTALRAVRLRHVTCATITANCVRPDTK